MPSAATQLAAFPEDPRIAMAVAAWAVDPITTSSSTYPFWTKMLDVVARSGDTRTIALFKKRLKKPQEKSQFWPKFYAALEKVIKKLEASPKPGARSGQDAALKKIAAGVAKLSKIERGSAGEGDGASQEEGRRREGRRDAARPRGGALRSRTRRAGHRRAPREMARDARVPLVADMIDRATRPLPTWDKPLGVDTKEIAAAWLEGYARDPSGTMPQLLQYLNVGGASFAERRVMDLLQMPDDPRVAMRLTQLAVQYGISPERTQYWKATLELIARTKDVRTCEPLKHAFRDFSDDYYNHHRQARRIVAPFAQNPEASFPGREWPLELDLHDRQELSAVEKALAKLEASRDRTEIELLDAVRKTWDTDDGPKLVYADWLTERNHPRGELIVLACKETRTKAESERLKRLSGAPFIYGELESLGRFVEVRCGLGKKIVIDYVTSPISWSVCRGLPLLSIVETLSFEKTEEIDLPDDLAGFVLDPETRALKNLENLSTEAVAKLTPLLKSRFRPHDDRGFVRI